jgi:chromosome segregation ATPase
MDEEITQLDRRLTAVEKDVAMLTAEVKHAQQHYATKEDAAELREEIVASELRLTTQIAAVDSKLTAQITAVDSKLSAQIAAVDSKLSAQIAALDSRLSAQIAALEGKILSMENRYVRWTIGTVIAVAGVVLAIVRTFP